MGGWHAVEGFIREAGKHSTWAGKFYNTFFDVFRLLFLVSIVDNTFKGSKKNKGNKIISDKLSFYFSLLDYKLR